MFALSYMLALAAAVDGSTWPRRGVHDGENRITWTSGCCDGDLVILDFYDTQGDGNQGKGLLHVTNSTSGYTNTYMLGPFWGTWKTYGPFCAPEGTHTVTFTSDANPSETTITVTDSFGLIRAKGGMSDFPVSFNTGAPNKFCDPPGGLTDDQKIKRARKLVAYHDQFEPHTLLEQQGREVPQEQGLSVFPNNA